MPKPTTAKLVNANRQFTTHHCVRLEIRRKPRNVGIYPVYRCTVTGVERDYGCYRAQVGTRRLNKMYPGVEMVYVDEFDDQAEDIATEEQAA